MSKYCANSNYGTVDNKTILELEDDAAHVNWGGNWRMPTKEEQDELISTNNCTWTWTTQNGVNGYKVISKINGNFIFIPAAGYRGGDGSIDAAEICLTYWSSSLVARSSYGAYCLCNEPEVIYIDEGDREYGLSVRAVCP